MKGEALDARARDALAPERPLGGRHDLRRALQRRRETHRSVAAGRQPAGDQRVRGGGEHRAGAVVIGEPQLGADEIERAPERGGGGDGEAELADGQAELGAHSSTSPSASSPRPTAPHTIPHPADHLPTAGADPAHGQSAAAADELPAPHDAAHRERHERRDGESSHDVSRCWMRAME